ncbi:MAG TPA: cupin domain-containing protein [Planctomycetota bacterium]|nr:cupin domain-containing protein [Planctomycetota bacterium]
MKHVLVVAGFLIAVGALSFLAAAATQDKQERKPDEKKEAVFFSVDKAKFKEVAKGASMAVVWGDPEKGAYRAFTKFEPGADFPMHTHTNALRIVVVKGAYVFRPENGEVKRVGPGCFLETQAGERHASGGDATEGALFYQESAGTFDLVPVETKK